MLTYDHLFIYIYTFLSKKIYESFLSRIGLPNRPFGIFILFFVKANSETKLGITKVYSLRPKCVEINPKQALCACVCCTNFDFCFCVLTCWRVEHITKQELIFVTFCSEPTPTCLRWDARKLASSHYKLWKILRRINLHSYVGGKEIYSKKTKET